MASGSNSTTIYSSNGKGYGLYTSFSETSTSTPNNTSTLSISGSLTCPNGKWSSNYTSYLRVYWHDNHENADKLIAETSMTSTYQGQTITVSGSKTVTHNSDGKLSGYAFTTFTQGSSSGGWCPASGSVSTGWVALTNIPRASKINSFTGNNIEGNFSVSYTSYYSGYTNKLRISIPSVIALQTKNYTSGTSFTLDQSTIEYLYNYMQNTNSVTLGAVIETWNGNTKIGESSELKNVCTITDADPIFDTFTYKDTNSVTATLTGDDQVLVKGVSTLQAKIISANKMVTQKGATPKNYVSTIDDINISTNYDTEDITIEFGTVNASGTQRLNVRAYDSRNNSTLVYRDIEVYDYEEPVIHSSVSRLNNWENQTTLKVNGTYSQLTINNVDKNTINNVQYRYRETNGTWGNWTNINVTINNGQYTCTDTIISLDNTKSFEFEIRVIDNIKTTVGDTLTLDVGEAIFFISSNKKMCYVNGEDIRLLPYPIGSIYISVVDTNPATLLGGGTWEQITSDAYLKIVDSNGGQLGGTSSNHKIPTSSMPAHNHGWRGVNDGASVSGQMGSYPFRIYQDKKSNWNGTTGYMDNAGGGQPYYPYYLGVYVWKRTA